MARRTWRVLAVLEASHLLTTARRTIPLAHRAHFWLSPTPTRTAYRLRPASTSPSHASPAPFALFFSPGLPHTTVHFCLHRLAATLVLLQHSCLTGRWNTCYLAFRADALTARLPSLQLRRYFCFYKTFLPLASSTAVWCAVTSSYTCTPSRLFLCYRLAISTFSASVG